MKLTGFGIAAIKQERARQIDCEGWSPSHDDTHDRDEMARSAAWYALPRSLRTRHIWPSAWRGWCKPTPRDRIRELAKAGALIAAEIDRLTRLKQKGRRR